MCNYNNLKNTSVLFQNFHIYVNNYYIGMFRDLV